MGITLENYCIGDFRNRDFPRSTSYGVYVSLLIRFARVSCHLTDFNICNKLLKQGYRYRKLRKTFFQKFYRRHYELVSKLKVGLISLLQQGLSELKLNGDLVYELNKI